MDVLVQIWKRKSALSPVSVQKCHQIYYCLLCSGRHCNCIIKDVKFFSLHKKPYPSPGSFSELLSKLRTDVNILSFNIKKIQAVLKPLARRLSLCKFIFEFHSSILCYWWGGWWQYEKRKVNSYLVFLHISHPLCISIFLVMHLPFQHMSALQV